MAMVQDLRTTLIVRNKNTPVTCIGIAIAWKGVVGSYNWSMTQTVLTLTLLVTALTLLVIALTVLRMHWLTGRTMANRSIEKRFAYPWLPMLGEILRAAGKFLRGEHKRQIHDRKRKR